jgi:hypothetical protein
MHGHVCGKGTREEAQKKFGSTAESQLSSVGTTRERRATRAQLLRDGTGHGEAGQGTVLIGVLELLNVASLTAAARESTRWSSMSGR